MLVLDMHVHTDLSGDAKPTVSEYAEWLLELKKEHAIHGFVITEHRYYSLSRNGVFMELSKKTGLVIFQGVELETDYGHLLAYGVTPHFLDRVDVTKRLKAMDVSRIAFETGTVVVPAHPMRPMLGGGQAVAQLEGLCAVETLNGANDRAENKMADSMSRRMGVHGTGGSDAHFVADFGSCMTRFEKFFDTDRQLAEELIRGEYRPIYLEESRHS